MLLKNLLIVLTIQIVKGTFLVVSNNNPATLPDLSQLPEIPQLSKLQPLQVPALQDLPSFQQIAQNLAALKNTAIEKKIQFLNQITQNFPVLPAPLSVAPVPISSPCSSPCSSSNSEALDYSPLVPVSSSVGDLETANALDSLVPAVSLKEIPTPDLSSLNSGSSFTGSKVVQNIFSKVATNGPLSSLLSLKTSKTVAPAPVSSFLNPVLPSKLSKSLHFSLPSAEISKEATLFNGGQAGSGNCNCDRFENLEIETLKHNPSETLSVLGYGIEVPPEPAPKPACRQYNYEIEKLKPQRQHDFDILQGHIDRIVEPNTDCCKDEESSLVLGKKIERDRRFLLNLPPLNQVSRENLNIVGPVQLSPQINTQSTKNPTVTSNNNKSTVAELISTSLTKIEIPKHYDPVIRQEPDEEPVPYTHMTPRSYHHLSDLLRKSSTFSMKNEGNFISPPPSTQMKDVLQLLIDLFDNYKNIPGYRSSTTFFNPPNLIGNVNSDRPANLICNQRNNEVLSLEDVQQLMKTYRPTKPIVLPPRKPDQRYQFVDKMAQLYKFKAQHFPIRQFLEPLYDVLTWQAQREVEAENARQQILNRIRTPINQLTIQPISIQNLQFEPVPIQQLLSQQTRRGRCVNHPTTLNDDEHENIDKNFMFDGYNETNFEFIE